MIADARDKREAGLGWPIPVVPARQTALGFVGSWSRQKSREVGRIKMDTGSVLNLVPRYRCPPLERSL